MRARIFMININYNVRGTEYERVNYTARDNSVWRGLLKLAVVSDGHLFQTFIEKYDSIVDFEKVLNEIAKNKPDVLLFAGDFFDARKSLSMHTTMNLRKNGARKRNRASTLISVFSVPLRYFFSIFFSAYSLLF